MNGQGAGGWRPVAAAGITFAIFAILSVLAIGRAEQERHEERRRELDAVASQQAAAIHHAIGTAMSATGALAALVRTGNGTIADFPRVAAELLPRFPGASEFVLAPGGVISQVYPQAGNDRAIGVNILRDPAIGPEAAQARDTRSLTLAGPFPLFQGGTGASGRHPVYLADRAGGERFWGFVSVVVKFPEVFATSGLDRLPALGFDYELWRRRPENGERQTIAASAPGRDMAEAVHHAVSVPNATWTLSVAERGPSAARGLPLAVILIAVAASFGMAALAWIVAQLKAGRDTLAARVAEGTRELRLANEQLRESEERFALAQDATRDGLFDWNLGDGSFYVNAAYARMLGYEPGEIAGRVPELLISRLHPDDRARVLPRVMQILESEGEFETEYRLRCRDGSHKWVLSRAKAVSHDEAGRARRVVGTHVDLTVRKRLEVALRKAKEQADLANRAKTAYLANMSYEIRTPLSGIVGMLHLLNKDTPPAEQAQRIEKLESASAHLLEVLDAILDLSKIEAEKLILDEKPLRVEALVANVIALVEAEALAKGIHLSSQLDALPAGLVGDPLRLQQALLNYATNAVKFTGEGYVTLRCRLVEEEESSAVLSFEVEDSGIGIAPEVLGRLFTAFEQADAETPRRYGGTGLGLAITRRLAELMDGEVGAESSLGAGSTFWFTVRLRKLSSAAIAAPPQPARSAEETLRSRHAGARILVVEDDAVNAEVTTGLLEGAGLAVEVAEDGAAGVSRATASDYALILMDLQMPRMDGLEATRQILAARPDGPPIVALTANTFTRDRSRSLDAGMCDFIGKPVNPEQLYGTVLRWLDQRRGAAARMAATQDAE